MNETYAPSPLTKISRIMVITQYAGGSIPLKDIRIIKSPFTVEEI